MTSAPLTASTRRLVLARARARRGTLLALIAAVALAVAATAGLGLWLAGAVSAAEASDAPETTAAGVRVLLASAPAPLLVVVLLGATAVTQLARLLTTSRLPETGFAHARGLSARQAAALAVGEAVAVTVVGVGAGTAIAAVAAATTVALAGTAVAATGVGLVAAVIGAQALVLVACLVVAAVRPADGGARTGRVARAAGVIVVVLVLLAAAFALWQLRSAPAGAQSADLIVAIAPPVVLLAAALLVLAVFAPLSRVVAALAARRRGLSPVLPARQVARRLPVTGVTVLLVGFAAGLVSVTAAYTATWPRLVATSAAVQNGADLRIDLGDDPLSAGLVSEVAGLDGIDAAAPVLETPMTAGSTALEMVALPTAALTEVISPATGIDAAALRDAVGVPLAGLDLGAATALRARVVVDSPNRATDLLDVTATVVSADGALERIRFVTLSSDAGADGAIALDQEAAVPAGAAPWRLLAITAQLRASLASRTAEISVGEVESVGGIGALAISGTAALDRDVQAAQVWLADPPAGDAPPRVVLTDVLAERLGLSEGDAVQLRYGGSGRSGMFEVAGTVAAVPGSHSAFAALAALDAVQADMLRRSPAALVADSVWASGSPRLADRVAAVSDGHPVHTSAPDAATEVAAALIPAWWIATGAAVVLSLLAALASIQVFARERRGELAVLRAVGVTAAAQARMRAAELAAAAGFALLAGAGAGALAAALLVPDLSRAAAPGLRAAVTAPLAFEPVVLIAGLGTAIAGVALLVLAVDVGVRRSVAGAVLVEEDR